MAVRIPSTLLKPAVCLLVSASSFLSCSVANALTFNWSWTATSASPGELVGTVVTGTIDNLVDNSLNTTGMTATFTGGFNVGQTLAYSGGNGIVVSNGSVVTSGLEAAFRSDDFQYQLQLSNPNGTIGLYGGYAASPGDEFPIALWMDNGTAPSFSSVSPVPAPLPMLGLPAVLFHSRKLKKRIKASREISSNFFVD